MAGRKENLKPQNTRTKAEQRRIAQMGGRASGKARREKKLMSQIYADLLADQSGIKKGGGIRAVVSEILNSTDPRAKSAKVALIKELREGTEGSKHLLGSDPDKPFDMTINIIGVKPEEK